MAAQLNGNLKLNKVIIITTQCFFPKIGGIEALMTGMAEAMSISGKVIVIADGKSTSSDSKKKYEIIRFNDWKPIRRIRKSNYVKKLCADNNVKAIYADSWKSIEYLDKLNIPIIVLAHGTEIQKNIGFLSLYKYLKQKRIKKSYQNSFKIAANSTYTKELIINSLGVDNDKITVIHPGIDIYDKFINANTINKINNLISSSGPVLVTLARLEHRKGHIVILEALSRLISKYPNLLYFIAGDGNFKKTIKNKVSELGLKNNVKFLGWITEPEKSVLLKNTDLFLMTPHLEKESVEGFGMVFIDAAFHGIATLGTDNGGISDAIINGKTGLIAKTSDLNDITSKIDELLSDKTKRIKLGLAGQKNAYARFTWDKKVLEYLNLI
ncbi:MAG: glycosyltransferase family 4 protein [Candidatus Pelagibacterales bacterium]